MTQKQLDKMLSKIELYNMTSTERVLLDIIIRQNEEIEELYQKMAISRIGIRCNDAE